MHAPHNNLLAHDIRHRLWSCWAVAFFLVGTPNLLLLLKAFSLISTAQAWWTLASLGLSIIACSLASFSVLYSVRCALHERTTIVMYLLFLSSDESDVKEPRNDNLALSLFASLLALTVLNSSIHQAFI